ARASSRRETAKDRDCPVAHVVEERAATPDFEPPRSPRTPRSEDGEIHAPGGFHTSAARSHRNQQPNNPRPTSEVLPTSELLPTSEPWRPWRPWRFKPSEGAPRVPQEERVDEEPAFGARNVTTTARVRRTARDESDKSSDLGVLAPWRPKLR